MATVNLKMAVNNGRLTLKNKHKLRCTEGKLDNRLVSAVIIGFPNFPNFPNFPIYILATCTLMFQNTLTGKH